MNYIDSFLNNFTMYRVVLYGLVALFLYSILLSVFKLISFSPLSLAVSAFVLVFVCYFSNLLFARLFRITPSTESSAITGFILYFLLWPYEKPNDLLLLVAASLIAMLSKYIFAYHKKHIFNPAALACVLLMFLNSGAIWWIATPAMLPLVILVGLFIVRKIRRFTMFFTFLSVSITTFLLFSIFKGKDIADDLQIFFLSFPVIFLGTVMLTEPVTTPPTRKLQMVYASIVGFIFSLQTPLGHFYPTPEAALLAGNLYSFVVSPKYRLKLKLLEKMEIAKDTLELVFERPKNFSFKAGQYLEWTLPILKADSRGNRRYFTIASSPTEDVIRLGVKLNNPSSAFKRYLKEISKGSTLTAGGLSGDFTLDHAKKKTLVLIAGGIGITPFKSMLKSLFDNNDKREIVLFYSNKIHEEIAFQKFLGEVSQKLNLKIVYVLTELEKIPKNFNGEKGRISETTIKKYVKKIEDADFYLSGPIAMINHYKSVLRTLGVKGKDIITDYFPGF